MNYTFPSDAEAFITYQEAEIDRKLDEYEQKLATVVVDLINGSYQEGVDGMENSVSIKCMREFFRECGKEPDREILRILECIYWWCDKAYQAGKAVVQ